MIHTDPVATPPPHIRKYHYHLHVMAGRGAGSLSVSCESPMRQLPGLDAESVLWDGYSIVKVQWRQKEAFYYIPKKLGKTEKWNDRNVDFFICKRQSGLGSLSRAWSEERRKNVGQMSNWLKWKWILLPRDIVWRCLRYRWSRLLIRWRWCPLLGSRAEAACFAYTGKHAEYDIWIMLFQSGWCNLSDNRRHL